MSATENELTTSGTSVSKLDTVAITIEELETGSRIIWVRKDDESPSIDQSKCAASKAKSMQIVREDSQNSLGDRCYNNAEMGFLPTPVVSAPVLTKDVSGSQEKSSKNVQIFSFASTRETINSSPDSPISFLENKILRKIFSYINHADKIQCRSVQRRWYNLISIDASFLEKTVFVLNMVKKYNLQTDLVVYNDFSTYAILPFRHARFQYMDYQYLKNPKLYTLRNSDNEKYFPERRFLKLLSSLEFRNCFLYWNTVKKMLGEIENPEELIINNCHLTSGASPAPEHLDEFELSVAKRFSGLKAIKIYETHSLDNITQILLKVSGYTIKGLGSLKITFHPPRNSDLPVAEDYPEFCRQLNQIISSSTNSLQILYLDIQHEGTLDWIGYRLSKELEKLGHHLKLTEFQLTPSLSSWESNPKSIPKSDVSMTLNSIDRIDPITKKKLIFDIATSFVRFLETQKYLEKLTVPCIQYPTISNSSFKTVLHNLPCAKKLKYLAVPSVSFLTMDLMHNFPKLREVRIGGFLNEEYKSGCEIFQAGVEYSPCMSQQSLGPIVQSEFKISVCASKMQTPDEVALNKVPDGVELLKNLNKFSLTTSTIPLNFWNVLEYMRNLTSLDINSENSPLVTDTDLQSCILNLPKLQNLVIGCADALTDFGITGIPNECCQLIFKHQRYHSEGVNANVWKSKKVIGRPLSDLKGLQRLILVGSGNNFLTDVGIGYGLSFPELQICQLPYSDTITSWGIERLGKANPSLEKLTLAGVSQLNKNAFIDLRRNHPRLKKGDASRSVYFAENWSPVIDNLSMILPPPPEILTNLFTEVIQKINVLLSLFTFSEPPRRRNIP